MALDAIAKADGTYRTMTGGWRLHDAPECFLAVELARTIAKYRKRYVTLEQSINDAVRWSKGTPIKGRTGNLPERGRFDIAV